MVVLVVDLEFDHDPRLADREHPRVVREIMRGIATDWHEYVQPRHFTPGNSARYRMERRTDWYRRNSKLSKGRGQGKYVANLLTGKSRRFAMAFAKITATQHKATVTMTLPSYFDRPYAGTRTVRKGRKTIVKRITRQPDKPRELTQITRDEDLALAEAGADRYAAAVQSVMEGRGSASARKRDSRGRFIK